MSINVNNNTNAAVIIPATSKPVSSFTRFMSNAITEKAIVVSENSERQILSANGGQAELVNVGNSSKTLPRGIYHSIHGANDSPKMMDEVNQAALNKGYNVYTLAYDDLGETMPAVNAYIQELSEQLEKNPKIPLVISAHSKGARIAHVALGNIYKENPELLKGRQITENLVNGYMGGHEGANYLDYLPDMLIEGLDSIFSKYGHDNARMIINLSDMGSDSKFQKMLDAIELPSNVQTNYISNENDLIAPFENHANTPALKNATIFKTNSKHPDPNNLYPGHTADMKNENLIDSVLVPVIK